MDNHTMQYIIKINIAIYFHIISTHSPSDFPFSHLCFYNCKFDNTECLTINQAQQANEAHHRGFREFDILQLIRENRRHSK